MLHMVHIFGRSITIYFKILYQLTVMSLPPTQHVRACALLFSAVVGN